MKIEIEKSRWGIVVRIHDPFFDLGQLHSSLWKQLDKWVVGYFSPTGYNYWEKEFDDYEKAYRFMWQKALAYHPPKRNLNLTRSV